MNKYEIVVHDDCGRRHEYYVETGKEKREVAADINKAWNENRTIQVNYKDCDHENIAIFDSKRVIGIEIRETLTLDELMKRIKFDNEAKILPCSDVEMEEM